jgi:hypothetical protein
VPASIQIAALLIAFIAGAFLLGLGVVALARPSRARSFLLGFAQSAGAHYAEMAGRILVGAALVVASPRMPLSPYIAGFGVALLASSVLLLCLPWTWHRSYGEWVLPRFVQHLGVVGSFSVLLGGVLIAATIVGAA